jgi:hypothetical protein
MELQEFERFSELNRNERSFELCILKERYTKALGEALNRLSNSFALEFGAYLSCPIRLAQAGDVVEKAFDALACTLWLWQPDRTHHRWP